MTKQRPSPIEGGEGAETVFVYAMRAAWRMNLKQAIGAGPEDEDEEAAMREINDEHFKEIHELSAVKASSLSQALAKSARAIENALDQTHFRLMRQKSIYP